MRGIQDWLVCLMNRTRYALYVDNRMVYPHRDGLFRPSCLYPEYPFDYRDLSDENNEIYKGIRELFVLMGLDIANYGSSQWNPLGEYIKPGMNVLVKPNLVMHENPSGFGTDCLFTHVSVIAAVIDYIAIALNGTGSITLADAPMQSCDFDVLTSESGLNELVDWYNNHGLRVTLKDMRGLRSKQGRHGLHQTLIGEAKGKVIDLRESSSFIDLPEDYINGLRITNYDPSELKKHHSVSKHEYYISSDLLKADFVVNLPKAKTHRKAGVTGALKNMVGVNVRKEYLPHHCKGAKADGFDEYEKSSMLRSISASLLDGFNSSLSMQGFVLKNVSSIVSKGFGYLGKLITGDSFSEGSWYGNDTIWRTVLDINKIVFHADENGMLCNDRQRGMLVICDMVDIGQGEGPLIPEPGKWHMLAICDDPTAHDVALSRMLGTDAEIIPTVGQALSYDGLYAWSSFDAREVRCASNDSRFNEVYITELNEDLAYCAKPSSGWNAIFKRKNKLII